MSGVVVTQGKDVPQTSASQARIRQTQRIAIALQGTGCIGRAATWPACHAPFPAGTVARLDVASIGAGRKNFDRGGGGLSWQRCTQHLCFCLHHLAVTSSARPGPRGGFIRPRGTTADTTAGLPMHPAPCSASLSVCLHYRNVHTASSQRPRAFDRELGR